MKKSDNVDFESSVWPFGRRAHLCFFLMLIENTFKAKIVRKYFDSIPGLYKVSEKFG